MYGRTITDVFLPDGMSLNQELIKQGWCWWYRRYAPGDVVLGGLETEAREAKNDLWVIPVQVPPWRKRSRWAARGGPAPFLTLASPKTILSSPE